VETVRAVLFSVGVAVTAASAAQQPAYDVAGVKLGMSADQVRSVLLAAHPGVKFQETKHPPFPNVPQQVAIIKAVSPDLGGIEVQFGVGTGKAYRVERTVVYGQANQPRLEAVQKSIADKYGKPEKFDGMNYRWTYDVSGKLTNARECRSLLQQNFLPHQVHQQCGIALAISVQSDPVSQMSQVLVSRPLLQESMDLKKQADDKARESALNKAQANTPKL